MIIPMNLGPDSYDIVVEPCCLSRAGGLLKLDRQVFIVTDDGVPPQYAETLAGQCSKPTVFCIPQGEESKCFARLERLLSGMLAAGLTRKDCVCAVGGGVVGDLSGFAAACYMRGIDFYDVPTTVLSQVDSSIGGKTAIDLDGIKNIVGAFHQPRGVLIDTNLLKTLPPRQIANGLAEAVKMAACFDKACFALFEEENPLDHMEEIITRSLQIKRRVVEEDEKEAGLRRVLNFGHTLGHGIESRCDLYHGECVALGMLPMCGGAVRPRLEKVLKKLGLPTECDCDADEVMRAVLHDKKAESGGVNAVLVDEIGSFRQQKMTKEELRRRYTDTFGQEART